MAEVCFADETSLSPNAAIGTIGVIELPQLTTANESPKSLLLVNNCLALIIRFCDYQIL